MKSFQNRYCFPTGAIILMSALSAASPAQCAEHNAAAAQVSAFIVSVNPAISRGVADSYARQAISAADDARIDPCLLVAVVSVESHWKADAVSRHGAVGLGQLKPQTAASLNANPFSVADNLRATSQYLRVLIDRFKSTPVTNSAIAAYNAGPTAVARNGGRAPNRGTETYVGKVLTRLDEARHFFGSALIAVADGKVHVIKLNTPPTTAVGRIRQLSHPVDQRRTAFLVVSRHMDAHEQPLEADFWNLPDRSPRLLSGSVPRTTYFAQLEKAQL